MPSVVRLKNREQTDDRHLLITGCQLDFVKKKVFLKGLIFKKKGFCNKKKVFRAKWIAF